MWCALFLVLFAGVASAEHSLAWKTDTEYQYVVRGRTLAALHDLSDQYTGIKLKAVLTVQPKSEDTLQAKVSKAQYARIHTKMPEGWKSEIPDNMVDFKQLPLSEKVFEVKMRHGVVRDLIVDKDIPTWEVNMLKSIVSQLQVDTQGENMKPSRYNQEPEENSPNAMYKTMEDSVSGKCEVLYDISPLPDYYRSPKPDTREKSERPSDEEAISIVKTKNHTNCEQRMSFHFGIPGSSNKEPSAHASNKFISRSSISRIIVTGDLKAFTIQSSVTTDVVVISPKFDESEKGMVGSKVNVTLVKMGPASSGPWSTPANPESTGNLVYNYNDPFARPGEDRRPGQSYSDPNAPDSDERVRYSDYKNGDDESSASESSKSADSLESTEQQKSYLQPKPTLEEAPSMPLLPFFVGNRGKSIQNSGSVDPVATVKSLASEIGRDLQNPDTITDEHTLEKFTTLARILRTMNAKQIAEAQRELYQSTNEIDPQDESQSVRRSTWVAFRDAVAQAGTGPALITIKNLLKEKKIRGVEAASVVGVLSKTARTPTPEYMDAFFELATMPETAHEEFLNSSAIVSFAELIRTSQVDHASAHNRYPVHSFGRLSPKHNPAVVRDYIPHMAEQMRAAIENKESAKAHVYIRALGATAHPKILAAYEPYLEGKSHASTFHRLLMVMSMDDLASLKPRLARGVLYRIYQNNAEAHQLRCAAVTLLIATNPPASMLQRIAEFTNYDHSKQVNAAVKSAIESASELTEPESQDLATKARNVRPLLNKANYGFEYSQNYLADFGTDDMYAATHIHAAQIGSKDSSIPQAVYASMGAIDSDWQSPEWKIGAMVSSAKDLWNELSERLGDERKTQEHRSKAEFSPGKIAQMLKLERPKSDELEGALWLDSPFENKMFSFDEHTLQRVYDLCHRASVSLKEGANVHVAKILSNDATVSFPMESGLPFLYTYKFPTLVKLSGSLKGHSDFQSIEGSADIRLVHAAQFQARLGFVAPFEHQHYSAGVNQNYHVHLPVRAKMSIDKSKKHATLKLEPSDPNEEHKILQVNAVPFTSRHDVLNTSPFTKDKDTHELRKGKSWETTSDLGSRTHGLNVKLKAEGDVYPSVSSKNDFWDNNPLMGFFFQSPKNSIVHRKIEISLVPNRSSSQSIILTASVETRTDDSKGSEKNNDREPKAEAPRVKSNKLDDAERRRQLLNEAAKGIEAAEAIAIDVGVDLPGQEPLQLISTIAYATSKVDEKSQGLMYVRLNNGERSEEACAALESRSPKVSIFDMEMAGKSPRKSRHFDIEVRAGKTCQEGTKIRINANQKQSEAYRQAVKELPSSSKCSKEAKAGKKSGPACQKLSDRLSIMDQAHMTIKFDPKDRSAKEGLAYYIELIGNIDDATMFRRQESEVDEDTLEMSMGLDPFEKRASFTYESSDAMINIPDVELGPLASLIANTDPDLSGSERFNIDADDADAHQMCVIDTNSAKTFDQASYPLHLGKCWHVALTSNPKNRKGSPSRGKPDENARLAVLIRDDENAKKEVKFTLGSRELHLKKVDNNIRAIADGKDVDLDSRAMHREMSSEEPDYEVSRRPDGSVRVTSSKHGIDAVYNGMDLRIKASATYRDELRGLCGNYDGEPDNDFTSPGNCIQRKPNEFAASYALPTSDCQGPARELSMKASSGEATCYRRSIRPANVVSESEAGRKSKHPSSWGFHSKKDSHGDDENRSNDRRCITVRTKIVEEEDKICFSLRPVPACAPGCRHVRTKPKVMPMYCMPKGPSAQKMAQRIRQGANPDLSQKEMSKKSAFDMPVSCVAA